MPYQYKHEPLSGNGVNRLTNACETFDGRFVILHFFNHGKVSFGGSVFHWPATTWHWPLCSHF